MFAFTSAEEETIRFIKINYEQQLRGSMHDFFKNRRTVPLDETKLETWLQRIKETHGHCEKWLEQMVAQPDFADHLGGGALSLMVRSGGGFFAFLINGALRILPKGVRRRLWGNRTPADEAGRAARNVFSSVLGSLVTGLLHHAFCQAHHGSWDEADTLFNEAIEKQGNLTRLIQQESEKISIELVKLFRFRELMLLGSKDKTALHYDYRKDFIHNANISPADQSHVDAVIEYYFLQELNEIFSKGFKSLYDAHALEIKDAKESVIVRSLNHYFDSKEQKEAFTLQIQMQFMEMTRDFLIAKMNEKSMLARHPWLLATGIGLLVSLSLGGVLLLAFSGTSAILGALALGVVGFGLGFMASYLLSTRIDFFSYKRRKFNRHCLQEAVDSLDIQFQRLRRKIGEMPENLEELARRSRHFAGLNKSRFLRRNKSHLARGSVFGWLCDFAGDYRFSKQMQSGLEDIYKQLATQSRDQNKMLIEEYASKKKKPKRRVQQWINDTANYLRDDKNAEDIRDFELREKFRQQILQLCQQLNDVPANILEFYQKPTEAGGLGGNTKDLEIIRRFGRDDFAGLEENATHFYKNLEPAFNGIPFFQGDVNYRLMLGLPPGRGTQGLHADTVDQCLHQTHAFLVSLTTPETSGKGIDSFQQPADLSDAFIFYRMLLMRQFAGICRGFDRHPEDIVIRKIKNFVQVFFHPEPDRIFDTFINSSMLLNPEFTRKQHLDKDYQTAYTQECTAHLMQVLTMSVAFIDKPFSSMQVLRYCKEKYAPENQHLFILEDTNSLLNPQGSQFFVKTLKKYLHDTHVFLKENQGEAGAYMEHYRRELSVAVFQLLGAALADIGAKTDKPEELVWLMKALQCLKKFIKKDTFLPIEGSDLALFWKAVQSLSKKTKPDSESIERICTMMAGEKSPLENVEKALDQSRFEKAFEKRSKQRRAQKNSKGLMKRLQQGRLFPYNTHRATANTLIPNPSPSREKGADCTN